MILRFKSMKVTELLKHYRNLSYIDKLRLSIHLLENKYLHIEDKCIKIKQLQWLLNKLDNNYCTTITNFNKYKNLIFLSFRFMKLTEIEQNSFIFEMLNDVHNSKVEYQ